MDLYPTLAELCGLGVPGHLEGTSFAPLLRDPARPWKRAVFSELKRDGVHGRSLRTQHHRYTEWGSGEGAAVELYDTRSDPGELTNLEGQADHAAVQAELARRLEKGWRGSLPP